MEHKLLIDTWGWLTLRDKKESRHGEIKAISAKDFILFSNLTTLISQVFLQDYLFNVKG